MTVLSIALKGALVLSLAGAAAYLLRRAPASARHAVWVGAFVALLVVSVFAAFGPTVELRVLPAEITQRAVPTPPEAPSAAPAPAPLGPVGAPVALDVPPVPSAPPALPASVASSVEPALAPVPPRGPEAPTALLGPEGWIASLWAGGALLVLLGWALPLFAARHLVGRARPETSGTWLDALEHARLLSAIEEPVRLLRSDRLDVPVAWGWGAPTIVLPASADEWDADRREAVLLHELAHLSRGDAQTQLLAQLAVALHWFNPLAWWAYNRMLEEREHACDDAVLRGGARPSAYAGHLVEIARGLRRRPAALAAFAPMARSSRLEGRVLSILGDRQRAAMTRLRMAGFVLVALGLALPLGACQLTSRTVETPEPPPPPPSPPIVSLAEVSAPISHEEETARAAYEDARESLVAMERDLETLLEPEMEAARARLAEIREEHGQFAEVDWAEIESEMEDALAAVEIDMEETLQDALEVLAEADWEAGVEQSLREAELERAIALNELRRELATMEREVQQEAERAYREAIRARTGALRDLQRESDRSRSREQRQRELERDERNGAQQQREIQQNRQREQRRRQEARSRQETASLASFRGPTAPPEGYRYAITTEGQQRVVVATGGPGPWATSLSGWHEDVNAIASQIATAETNPDDLRRSLAQMENGLAGIERAASVWAESATEHRMVSRSFAEARAALADALHILEKAAPRDDDE